MEAAERIAELEAELKQRDAKIKLLTTERDEAQELLSQMRQHVEDHDRLIEQWIEVFEMQQNEAGTWIFDPQQSELWTAYDELLKQNKDLIGQWNKFVPQYNATVNPRPIGRPLAASVAQQRDVVKRRKAGASLRTIAHATGLGLRTVCTILEQRTRANKLRRQTFDRSRAAAYRARRKSRERLPRDITDHLKTGAVLLKAAKGIG